MRTVALFDIHHLAGKMANRAADSMRAHGAQQIADEISRPQVISSQPDQVYEAKLTPGKFGTTLRIKGRTTSGELTQYHHYMLTLPPEDMRRLGQVILESCS